MEIWDFGWGTGGYFGLIDFGNNPGRTIWLYVYTCIILLKIKTKS